MKPYILLIRVDNDDKMITQPIFEEIGHDKKVIFIDHIDNLDQTIATNGEPAIILLNDAGAAHSSRGLLKDIKTNPAYAHIPVVILVEVSTEEYIRECYRAGANSFIIKPSSIAETKKKIDTFFTYWLEVAE
jgi:DNA-binding NarL/FixJ family response regulator